MSRSLDTSPRRSALIGSTLLAIIVLFIGFGFHFFGESYQTRIVYSTFVNLIIVIGIQVFMGNANVTAFSHSAFMGIAAYAAAICVTPIAMKTIALPDAPWGLNNFELSPLASILIAYIITGILGTLVGLFIVRLTGVGVTIVSIAILVIVHSIFLYRTDIFKGNQAFFGIPQIFTLPIITFIAAGSIFVARLFKESSIGVQLRASADDETGARAMGVNVFRVRLIAWIVSTLFLATGGIAYAFFLGTISARPFYFHFVFLTVAMLILGGMRTVTGAVIGTFLISFGLEFIRWLETGPSLGPVKLPEMLGLSGLMLGIVIVLTMAYRPQGLTGNHEIESWFGKWRRK